MPSGKEYSMRFILESQLGSNFKGSFTQAQKQLQQMQSQIQALSKEQANIAAYQKQQEAVEKTSRKLMDLQKEYDNIQREISETEGFSSSLENKLIEKQRAIDNTSASLQKQTDRLDQYQSALQESGLDTKNLSAESDRLTSELKELREEQARLNDEAENYGTVGASSFAAVGEILIAAGITKGLNEIKEAYADCVKLAADFQSTMSTVEALSGANEEDMAQLSALAKELGATTKFTATESAQAMTYMAMAGWDASQMMSGMDGVMQLAAASGEDLALVSDIVTDNLTAFGLAASDTARFSDVLAAAATSSNTSVAIMGETFKGSAAIAGALGYSIEDVAMAVGLMANSGVKGSIAGTALKNMFNGLLEGATLTSEAFGEVEYTTINADGTLKSFSDTIDDLRVYFEQMTDAERVNNAMALAGQRGYNGLLAILNATDADYQKLTESINNSAGAAQRMANIKLDNLQGQLVLLDSAADAVKTTVGEAYQNEFQGLAKIGTEILTEVNEFLTAHPQVLRFVIALTAEVGALVAIYTTYKAIKSGINVVKALSIALTAKETAATTANTAATVAETAATGAATTAQVGLNAAMAASPIGAVTSLISLLVAGLTVLISVAGNAKDEAEQLTAASQEQKKELEALRAEYQSVCEAYGEQSEYARELHGEMLLLEEDFERNKVTLAEFNEQIQRDISAHEDLVSSHDAAISKMTDEEDAVNALTRQLKALSTQSSRTAEEKEELDTIVSLLSQKVPNLALAYDKETDSLNKTAEAIEAVIRAEQKQRQYEQYSKDAEAIAESKIQYEKDLAEAIRNTAAAQDEYNYLLEHGGDALAEQARKQVHNGYGGVPRNLSQAQSQMLDGAKKKVDELAASEQNLRDKITECEAEQKEWNEVRAEYEADIERQRRAIEVQEEARKAAAKSTKDFAKALAAVKLGYLDINAAAAHFGVSIDYLQESADEIDTYKEHLESAFKAVEKGFYSAEEAAAIYGVTVEDMEVTSKIDETASSLAGLVERYNEVYESAYNSINGQYELWDTAAVVIPKNIEDINTALETQTSYWSDYNTDLTNLLGRVEDIEGLRDIIASFADGSEDSVNAIAGMAAASDEDLREMVKNWQEVKRYQQEAVDSVSELSTGFSEQYDEMRGELETAVEDLNLSDEAADAAEQTVEAYVEAIRNGTDEAVKEAERLSSLVAMALYNNHGAIKPSASGASGRGGQISYVAMSAYAVGTDNAAPGAALVGENGPEIVMFDGGEKVFTAEETKKLLRESERIRELDFESVNQNRMILNSYAIGTDRAQSGAALVGENEPELIERRSKDIMSNTTIYDVLAQHINEAVAMQTLSSENAETVQVMSMLPAIPAINASYAIPDYNSVPVPSQQVEITISPSFSIEGVKEDDDIVERLREFGEELKDEIIDALEEAGIDSKRRKYE